MSTLLDKQTVTPRASPQSQRPPRCGPTGFRPAIPKLSVIVPTLNEAKNLPIVFAMLPEGLHEVIVVDGRSTDDTIKVAKQVRPDVRIVLEDRPGKGWALAAGFAAATGDILVMLDCDGCTPTATTTRPR